MPTLQSTPDVDVPDPDLTEAMPVEATSRRRRLPTFGLSVTQIMATGLAATTATIAASFLGVTGTVIGAALASMTTAVGNAVYGQSLRRGGQRVRTAVPGLASRPVPTAADETGTSTTERRQDIVPVLPASPPVRPVVWKRVAIGAVSVFVVVLAVVTGVEVVAGRPIADVVRGDSGSGTSFFGGARGATKTMTVTPVAPTQTVTVTPKVVFTTPTVTETAPAATQTATPSTTPTVTPTPSSTPSPHGTSASTTTSPSASTTSTR